MKNRTSLRSFINEQKSSSEFKPDNHFVMNLEKILNNKIQLMQSEENKKQETTLQEKKVWYKKPQYAFAFVMTLLLIISASVGTYIYINQNKPVGITPIVKSNTEKAAEVLASVNRKVEELKQAEDIISYSVNQKTFNLEDGSESTPTYCQRIIDYKNLLQRNECGLDYGSTLVPIYSNNTNILKGEKIYFNPELSTKYYEELFGIDMIAAEVYETNGDIVKIRLIKEIDDSAKDPDLRFFEQQNSIASKVILEFEINNAESKMLSVKVSYQFEDKIRPRFLYNLSKIEVIEYNPDLFNEKKPVAVAALRPENINPIYNKTKKEFTLKLNAKANTNYIILRNEEKGTVLVDNILATDVDRTLDLVIPSDRDLIIIKPYVYDNYYTSYGDGVSFFYYIYNPGENYPDQLTKSLLEQDSFDGINYPVQNAISTIGNSATIKDTRFFSNSKVAFAIPSGWEIAELECEDGECKRIIIRKDMYAMYVDTELTVTGGGFGSQYDSMCEPKRTVINFSDKLQRIDSFVNAETEKANPEMCFVLPAEGSKEDHWYNSRFVVKGTDTQVPLILRSKLLGIEEKTEGTPDVILIQYEYGPIANIGGYVDAPKKSDPEFLQRLGEMDLIVRSIEFKR